MPPRCCCSSSRVTCRSRAPARRAHGRSCSKTACRSAAAACGQCGAAAGYPRGPVRRCARRGVRRCEPRDRSCHGSVDSGAIASAATLAAADARRRHARSVGGRRWQSHPRWRRGRRTVASRRRTTTPRSSTRCPTTPISTCSATSSPKAWTRSRPPRPRCSSSKPTRTHEEAVNTVFRAFHTVKGTSAFLGLGRIAAFAHEAESLLSRVRDQEIAYTRACAELSLRRATCCKALLDVVKHAAAGNGHARAQGYTELLDALATYDPAPSPRGSSVPSRRPVRSRAPHHR
jgi:HPt (histidine-containing phosphotransfer) domain-containing protein